MLKSVIIDLSIDLSTVKNYLIKDKTESKMTRLQKAEIAIKQMSDISLGKYAASISITLKGKQFASLEWEELARMLRITLREMDHRSSQAFFKEVAK